jgi:hypothetical protein
MADFTFPPPPAAAQLSYTTNVFSSPEFIGAAGTMIALFAGKMGVHVLDDPATQQMAVAMLGMILTGFFHWLFPNASGRLSLTAPSAANVPAARDVPVGPSVVTVPHPQDDAQVATVQPIVVGTQTVTVAAASQDTLHADAAPMAVVVTSAP